MGGIKDFNIYSNHIVMFRNGVCKARLRVGRFIETDSPGTLHIQKLSP